jgi:hypothetical protein
VVRRSREDVGEVLEGADAIDLAGSDQGVEASDVLPGVVVSDEDVVLAPEGAAGRSARSEALLSTGSRASSRKRVSARHWLSA